MNAKILLILVISSFSFSGFSQSAKKQYKANLAQFEALKKQYDSISEPFKLKKNAYNKDIVAYNDLRSTILTRSIELKGSLFDTFAILYINLYQLNDFTFINYKVDSLDKSIQTFASNIYSTVKGLNIQQKFPYVNLLITEIDIPLYYLNTKTTNSLTSELNPYLSALIREIDSTLKEVEHLEQLLPQYNKKLFELSESLDQQEQYLKTIIGNMEKRLAFLKENYAKNGPDGFSPFYKTMFPDVFPDPKPIVQKDQEEYLGFGYSKTDPFYGSVPPRPTINEYLKIKSSPEVLAAYPNGNDALEKYIQQELQVSQKSKKSKKPVFIRFVVKSDGTVAQPQIINFHTIDNGKSVLTYTYYYATENYDVITKLSSMFKNMPLWIPAKDHGIPVNQHVVIAVYLD